MIKCSAVAFHDARGVSAGTGSLVVVGAVVLVVLLLCVGSVSAVSSCGLQPAPLGCNICQMTACAASVLPVIDHLLRVSGGCVLKTRSSLTWYVYFSHPDPSADLPYMHPAL